MIKIIKYYPKDLKKSSFEVTFRGKSEIDLSSQILVNNLTLQKKL